MKLLFLSKAHEPEPWVAAFREHAPDIELVLGDEAVSDPAEIEAALAWKPKPGLLRRFPNLRLISSFGAGVDHILADPKLPKQVPIVRVVDPDLTRQMSEYVVLHVLRHHRQMDEIARNQKRKAWKWMPPPEATERVVGIMGMGTLGQDAAKKLVALGFSVAGWSQSLKAVKGVTSFHGRDHLEGFLRISNILVCLLPLTPKTRGIISRRTLSLLPKGAYFINAGRGGHVIEDHLLAALDSDRLSGATLDVFSVEPLPPDHPFWVHRKVTVTPHNAADSVPMHVVPQIVENIRRLKSGRHLRHEVDRAKGY